ncbi:hypothetical protein HPE56_07415 [Maribacter sp. ANRC-HE7]|uniref:PKD domain-containing protein n=1 Tax=Maribacter aquimaris TaxID=2737171 RepID=A0ABR7V1P0_9FLAO|nr:hypothetical protein [Maribacter aquimaris]MBD0777616.1 hypothetical protein [Maribacter aquimaris]
MIINLYTNQMQLKLTFKLMALLGAILFISSCSDDDEEEMVPMSFANSDYQSAYEFTLGDTLVINQEIQNIPLNTSFSWVMGETVIATTKNVEYILGEAGTFAIEFNAKADNDSLFRAYQLTVNDPYELYFRPKTESSSEYISEIIEYKPAPGQFINDAYGTMEAAAKIVGGKSDLLSLGAWGGYVVFTFDHTIENQEDAKDFVVYGNAMNGLSEPGIVQVSFDGNGNGLPDDAWYELAGSAHDAETTLLDYATTYTNPGEHADVPWVDNRDTSGSVLVSSYHAQNYYPLFIEEQEEVTFSGTKVSPTINSNGFVSIDALEWGYVDNFDAEYSTYGGNALEIDWAVDADGNVVDLKGIDFVKVYSGVQENAGWLGEVSTEIKGASDLSMIN